MPPSESKPGFLPQKHLHQSCQFLVQELSLDAIPEKIIKTACAELHPDLAVFCLTGEHGVLEKVVTHGITADDDKRIKGLPWELIKILSVATADGPIRVAKIEDDSRKADLLAIFPQASSFLGVIIKKGSDRMGYLYLGNRKSSPEFTTEDQETLGVLAGYAAVAIKNARMYKTLVQRDFILTRRNENMALLDKLASTLATATDINQIFEAGLAQLMDYLHLDVGEIFLRQEDSKNIRLAYHQGRDREKLWKRDQFVIGEGVLGRSFQSNCPAVFDLSKDPVDELIDCDCDDGLNQLAVIPLTGRRGTIGVLCVAACHPQPLDETEVQFLQAIGSWLATAIDNVTLNTQDKRLAVLEERERIGMDLHDGIIQSIYAVGLTLEHAHLLIKENPEQSSRRIAQSIEDLNSTIRDIRAYILDLRPRQLRNEDLMSGIGRLVAEFKANTFLEVNLQGPADDISILPKNQAVALFHICQEALANIAKHAHAHHVDVVVWTTDDRLLLEIRDDGSGFDMEKTRFSLGHGLANMETRIKNAGGEVDITSEPGKGTSILAWIPMPEDESVVVE